jgi:hypothetical protein
MNRLWAPLACGGLLWGFFVAGKGIYLGLSLIDASPVRALSYAVNPYSVLVLCSVGFWLASRGLWRDAIVIPVFGGFAYDAEWTAVHYLGRVPPVPIFPWYLPPVWAGTMLLGFFIYRRSLRPSIGFWFVGFAAFIYVAGVIEGPSGVDLRIPVETVYLLASCYFLKVPALRRFAS